MEICGHLAKTDVSNLQNELRSALNDLNVTPDVESDKWDIRDAIAALLAPTEAAAVSTGESPTLTWSATGATGCTASGGWAGNLATSGSRSTGALTSSTTFTLECTGPGGSATRQVTVAVSAGGSVPTPDPGAGSGGGGGGSSSLGLLALLGLAGARRRPPRGPGRDLRTASLYWNWRRGNVTGQGRGARTASNV